MQRLAETDEYPDAFANYGKAGQIGGIEDIHVVYEAA
jgi:hypothetical protein